MQFRYLQNQETNSISMAFLGFKPYLAISNSDRAFSIAMAALANNATKHLAGTPPQHQLSHQLQGPREGLPTVRSDRAISQLDR
jgi:hypothetical protein